MKLILRDYIATLKEEIELENVLQNILFLDNYKDITTPQKGIRQHGVDISCSKGNTSYLFVLKQGDIDRKIWNTEINSVRQSLDEIKDAYLRFNSDVLKPKIKIILCTNGTILQEVKNDWDGYITRNKVKNIEYEFWGLDTLVNYTFDLFPNEYIFDQNKMSYLRKTLYFSNECDNDLRYLSYLLDSILNDLSNLNRNTRHYRKNLCMYSLITKMCCEYCIDNDNNRVAIRIVEKAMIKFWNYLLQKNLFEKTNEISVLLDITKEYEKVNRMYICNIEKVCTISPSFPIYNSLEYRLQVYEAIGFISVYTNYLLYYYGENQEVRDNIQILILLLNNNIGGWRYPVYDLNSIEINSLLLLLYKVDKDSCKNVLIAIKDGMITKMKLSKYHPIEIKSYDKAVLLEFNDNIGDFESTNLIYSLFEWLFILGMTDEFEEFRTYLEKKFPKLSYNPWTIKLSDEELYFNGTNYRTGTYISNYGKIDVKSLKKLIKKIIKISDYKKFKTIKYSGEPYFLIAAKVNEMPIPPFLWQLYCN